MDEGTISQILAEYDERLGLYQTFATRMKGLLVEILGENRLEVHSVTGRVKDRESLYQKLLRPESRYVNLSDVTDVVGIRIITYLADDVDRIAGVIEEEFAVDRDNSIDKRAILDPDRFGYVSLHHVISLPPGRVGLTEYRRFPGLKAEVQTRSILQHAWAEIEHDLGYKTTLGVPREIRRRFSRLSGLLELADQEFVNIRQELDQYERDVPGRIEKAPEDVGLDKASLAAFLAGDELVHRLDRQIVEFASGNIIEERDPALIEEDVARLEWLGIKTVGDLKKTLAENADKVLVFARIWLADVTYSLMSPGISLLYLCYVLLAESGNPKKIREFLDSSRIQFPGRGPWLVEQIVSTYQAVRNASS